MKSETLKRIRGKQWDRNREACQHPTYETKQEVYEAWNKRGRWGTFYLCKYCDDWRMTVSNTVLKRRLWHRFIEKRTAK